MPFDDVYLVTPKRDVRIGRVELFVSHDAGVDPGALRRFGERLEAAGLTRRPIRGSG